MSASLRGRLRACRFLRTCLLLALWGLGACGAALAMPAGMRAPGPLPVGQALVVLLLLGLMAGGAVWWWRRSPAATDGADGLQEVLAQAPVGVLVLDRRGRVVQANAHAVGLFDGQMPVHGRRLLRAMRPWQRHALWRGLKASGEACIEAALTGRDGGSRWLWLAVRRLGPDRYVGCLADITGRQQEAQRLRCTDAVFRHALEGVVITDPQAQVVAANPAFTRITGYAEDELRGRNMRLLNSGRQDARFYALMWQQLTTEGSWQGEMWNRRKSGEVYPLRLSINAVRDEEGRIVHYVGACIDISQAKASEQALHHLAHHDALTGLPNRLMLFSLLDHALQRARHVGKACAVLMLDLDRFKTVNDSLGHLIGDEVLQAVAHRLRERLRGGSTLARLNGDEFAVLLEDLHAPQDAASVARQLIDACAEPVPVSGGREVYVGLSVGISLFPTDAGDPPALMQAADAALHSAKALGRGRCLFYTDRLTRQARQRLDTEARLRRALERGELELHYQPLVDVATREVCGVEALVRWRDPQRGLVPPGEFIPLAEETGLIVPLGWWTLEEALRQMRAWRDEGAPVPRVAVNLSAAHFAQPQLAEQLGGILAGAGVPPGRLELEITETALMDAGHAAEQLQRLKALGVRLAIDDFGTGYSSLAYLSRFPLDKLKMDGSFVRDLPHDATAAEIASAVLQLGRALGMEVLAEGVESPDQLAFLHQRGCGYAQGYLFARPLPAPALAQWLREPR